MSITGSVDSAYLHEDVSYRLVAATTTILVVSTILLSLRLYIRTLPTISAGSEDFWLILAYLLSVGACITGYLAVSKGGAGRHVEYVVMKNPSMLATRGKLLYSLSWVSGFSNCFSRVSILVIFYRIFAPGIIRICTIILMAYMVLFVISQSIAAAVECRPLTYSWDKTIKGTCINLFLFYKLSGILNIVGDAALMVLPLPTVWNLHASRAKRVGIVLVFLSGSVGLIASCFRTASFFTSAKQSMEDPTWTDVSLMSWTIVESGMYTAAASMMRLRPLLSKLPDWLKIGTVKDNSEESRRNNGGHNQAALNWYGHGSKQSTSHRHIPLGSFERDIDEEHV